MNNKIENRKVEVPKGIMLNDKDYINFLLTTLKEMVKNYAIVITEVSNEYLYKEYKSMLDEYSLVQRKAFEVMFKKGWYVLEKAEETKINSKHQLLSDEYLNLNI